MTNYLTCIVHYFPIKHIVDVRRNAYLRPKKMHQLLNTVALTKYDMKSKTDRHQHLLNQIIGVHLLVNMSIRRCKKIQPTDLMQRSCSDHKLGRHTCAYYCRIPVILGCVVRAVTCVFCVAALHRFAWPPRSLRCGVSIFRMHF